MTIIKIIQKYGMKYPNSAVEGLVLCDAMLCRVEDGDATAEDWADSNGDSLPADRFWNDFSGATIAADDEGHCMGIELNIWERAKVIYIIVVIVLIVIIVII